jgi:hypothetical protein
MELEKRSKIGASVPVKELSLTESPSSAAPLTVAKWFTAGRRPEAKLNTTQ